MRGSDRHADGTRRLRGRPGGASRPTPRDRPRPAAKAAGAALAARRAAARATAGGSGGLDFRPCPDAEGLPGPTARRSPSPSAGSPPPGPAAPSARARSSTSPAAPEPPACTSRSSPTSPAGTGSPPPTTSSATPRATLYPGGVRRMVLDSAVDPDPRRIWYRNQLDQSPGFERRWYDFRAWAARHHDTYGLGATPAAVQASYARVRDAVARRPPTGRPGTATTPTWRAGPRSRPGPMPA